MPVGQPELEAPAGTDRDRSTVTVTLTSASKAANILINRSSVKRPRSALRTREKSAAANPVSLAAALTSTPIVQHRDDSRGKDGLGPLQVGLGVAEVSEDVRTSVNEFDLFLTQGTSSFPGRASSLADADWQALQVERGRLVTPGLPRLLPYPLGQLDPFPPIGVDAGRWGPKRGCLSSDIPTAIRRCGFGLGHDWFLLIRAIYRSTPASRRTS